MKTLIGHLLIPVGFCVAAVGAAGFHSPALTQPAPAEDVVPGVEAPTAASDRSRSTESLAWPLLLGGIVVLVSGGMLVRTRSAGQGEHHARETLATARARIEEIKAAVTELERADLDDKSLLGRIDELRSGVFYDLGEQSDDLARQLGFDAYSKMWTGVATCERLINRCWSMAADGHGAQGREELPLARAAIEEAAAASATLG